MRFLNLDEYKFFSSPYKASWYWTRGYYMNRCSQKSCFHFAAVPWWPEGACGLYTLGCVNEHNYSWRKLRPRFPLCWIEEFFWMLWVQVFHGIWTRTFQLAAVTKERNFLHISPGRTWRSWRPPCLTGWRRTLNEVKTTKYLNIVCPHMSLCVQI
jgi:hypothetical protein